MASWEPNKQCPKTENRIRIELNVEWHRKKSVFVCVLEHMESGYYCFHPLKMLRFSIVMQHLYDTFFIMRTFAIQYGLWDDYTRHWHCDRDKFQIKSNEKHQDRHNNSINRKKKMSWIIYWPLLSLTQRMHFECLKWQKNNDQSELTPC